MSVVDLKPGQRGVITHVGGEGAFRRRILELGLLPGVVLRLGPLGASSDPLTVLVRGMSLSLRRADAATIFVTVAP